METKIMETNAAKGLAQPVSHGLLSRTIFYLSKVLDPLAVVGAVIACASLAAMMFLTFFDVAGTQLGKVGFIHNLTDFFRPIIGSQEITELMMVVLVAFALSYTALRKGHIRVDLVMQYTSKKANHWFDVFTYGFSCIMYILIAWQAWVYAFDNLDTGVVSTILSVPIPPFNFLLVIGAGLAALVFLRDFLKSIEEVRQ